MRYFMLALLSLSLSACVFVNGRPYGIGSIDHGKIRGSGDIETVTRMPGEFTRIELGVPARVEVQVGEKASLVLEGDDNLLAEVETSVQGGKLVIEPRRHRDLRFSRRLVVRVTCARLEGFEVEGSGDVRIANVNSDRFDVSIEGSGSVAARGVARAVTASIEGSGELFLGKLEARQASVSIEGSGSVGVHVADSLRYSIEGSGDIRYEGEPRVSGGVEGSGSVRRR